MTKPLSLECEYIISFASEAKGRNVEIYAQDDNRDAHQEALLYLEDHGYITTKNETGVKWITRFIMPIKNTTMITIEDRHYKSVALTLKGMWYFWIHLR